MDKNGLARESILKESGKISGARIKGYDFNEGVDYDKIIDSFSSTGFQASHLSQAIEIVNEMQKNYKLAKSVSMQDCKNLVKFWNTNQNGKVREWMCIMCNITHYIDENDSKNLLNIIVE